MHCIPFDGAQLICVYYILVTKLINHSSVSLAFSSLVLEACNGSTFDDICPPSMVEPVAVADLVAVETLFPSAVLKNIIFGTKTRLRVKEVQKMVRNEDKEKWIVGWSATTPRIGITRIQGMMTLYKDKPISLLSFKARICTLRVSQAK